MEIANIQIQKRSVIGSNQVAYLRGDGQIPAVLYGMGGDTVPVSLNHQEMSAHLRNRLKVYRLEMDGKQQPAFLKDVQWDVLSDEPIHIDFQRIEMEKPIELIVELSYIGNPKGTSRGGSLSKDKETILLSCMPEAIPLQIEVKVGPLDLGDKLTADQLELPEGCKLAIPGSTIICKVN